MITFSITFGGVALGVGGLTVGLGVLGDLGFYLCIFFALFYTTGFLVFLGALGISFTSTTSGSSMMLIKSLACTSGST